MGSGFRTFAASEVLTSSNVQNYLMDQAVTVHGGTAALATAIPSPEAGMVAYVNSNDSSEGLYTHTGSAWVKGPGWNAPWGAVSAPATKTSSMPTFTSTSPTDFTSLTLSPSLIQNRMYRCTFQCLFDNPAGISSIGVMSIYNNTSGTQLQQGNYTLAAGSFILVHLQAIFTASSSAAATIKVRGGVGGASQQFRAYGDATFPAFFLIEDIGPNGAPA